MRIAHFFLGDYSPLFAGIFPSADSKTAIHRVESNWAVMINVATNNG